MWYSELSTRKNSSFTNWEISWPFGPWPSRTANREKVSWRSRFYFPLATEQKTSMPSTSSWKKEGFQKGGPKKSLQKKSCCNLNILQSIPMIENLSHPWLWCVDVCFKAFWNATMFVLIPFASVHLQNEPGVLVWSIRFQTLELNSTFNSAKMAAIQFCPQEALTVNKKQKIQRQIFQNDRFF